MLMMKHTAEQMAIILLNFLKEKRLDIANCGNQSDGNAPNMLERYNGVQSFVKRKCKYATLFHAAITV